MTLHPYLNFNGNCEAALKFYEQHLGGKPGPVFRYGGTPMEAPPGWENKIMHSTIEIGGQIVMASDAPAGHYQTPQGITISLQFTEVAEAEKVFAALSQGGQVIMPLEKTFWAERFGIVTDQFSIPWLINCGEAQ